MRNAYPRYENDKKKKLKIFHQIDTELPLPKMMGRGLQQPEGDPWLTMPTGSSPNPGEENSNSLS